ncbi:protein tyrosine phosphatase family protein [Sphingomonas immobilis]|uniref:TIGR01244 family sulfur transferase n=1 Tax=Sphingomonas immobilis TaxID=3063997 RepID=A0ABT9A3V0_9SPHN|nr:TIGR01244 family sulfur transferase [Sphingomonas sp. CA1-15]MDO7843890.1 TIGR01244 family sulfur transferase [Sphingomonas sp. CA1-15]
MADIRKIDDTISVAPQISAGDVAEAKALGFVAFVNNRPDGEEPSAPQGDEIAAAVASAGLTYTAIPITHAGFSHPQIDAMVATLEAANGPVLAYCRSGTRSCNLWALARAKMGDDPDTLVEKGAAAGYDLNGLRPLLETLSGKA